MNVEISVECEKWNKLDVKLIAIECIRSVFLEMNVKNRSLEICLLFTDDREIRSLNKTYRGIDSPTNVLSFPSYSKDDTTDCFTDEKSQNCILGSIVVAYETIEQEAIKQGKKLENHLRHLIIHSILHLLGYEHANDDEAEKMESLEVKILEKLNVENPYLYDD